jgi:hypothetical protein
MQGTVSFPHTSRIITAAQFPPHRIGQSLRHLIASEQELSLREKFLGNFPISQLLSPTANCLVVESKSPA